MNSATLWFGVTILKCDVEKFQEDLTSGKVGNFSEWVERFDDDDVLEVVIHGTSPTKQEFGLAIRDSVRTLHVKEGSSVMAVGEGDLFSLLSWHGVLLAHAEKLGLLTGDPAWNLSVFQA